MKKQNNNNGLLFLAGAIAGGAAVYFLKSQKGQKIREVLLQQADQIGHEIKSKTLDAVQTVSSTAEHALNSASSVISATQSKVKEVTNGLAHSGEESIDDFQQGVERAQEQIEQRIENG